MVFRKKINLEVNKVVYEILFVVGDNLIPLFLK